MSALPCSGDALDGEAEAPAGGGERRDVAGALVAVPEVLADDDRRDVQPLDEHLVHELVRRVSRRNSGVNGSTHMHVDAERLEQLGLERVAGEQRRVAARAGRSRIGCGSKVSTTAGTPRSRAARRPGR